MANRLFSRPSSQRLGNLSRRGFRLLACQNQKDNSNQDWKPKSNYREQILFENPGSTVWPDPNLGCLGAKDKRFNFPGNVGLDPASAADTVNTANYRSAADDLIEKKLFDDELAFWHDLCDSPTSYQRQVNTLYHHNQGEKVKAEQMAAGELAAQRDRLNLECIPKNCPDLLRREMIALFALPHLASGPLTVVNFCHRTQLDMSIWNPDVESERDVMVDYFMKTAQELCQQLRGRAQWADFIDPSSGRPYYGKYTNLTFFETDERYRHLGFRVVDLGCCKVISHHKWGTHAFVGSIFTTAPHDSEYLAQILENYNPKLH